MAFIVLVYDDETVRCGKSVAAIAATVLHDVKLEHFQEMTENSPIPGTFWMLILCFESNKFI